jgi:hypothetical protein
MAAEKKTVSMDCPLPHECRHGINAARGRRFLARPSGARSGRSLGAGGEKYQRATGAEIRRP